jgi:peptide/nickel transport system permease protein
MMRLEETMGSYILRRFLLIIPTLLVATLVIFFLIRAIPGDVVTTMVAEQQFASGVTVDAIRHELGLDAPGYIQYARWLSALFRGDLGNSLITRQPVSEDIINRIPVSAELGTLAIIIALLIALPFGTYSAIRQDTVGDYISRSIAISFIALPSFWIGTLIMVYPSIWWNWSPPMQYISFVDNPAGNLRMFILPAAILGMVLSGTTMRMTRTMMLEVLRQDYIRTAWAKGLHERVVIFRHALRNALIPVITIIGIQLPVLVGGSVVLEQIFNLPGLGRLLIDALSRRDYTMLSGINLVMAAFVLVMNLFVDFTYAYLDPRVHYK